MYATVPGEVEANGHWRVLTLHRAPDGCLEGEAVPLLPPGIYWNAKGLSSLELLLALDISTDRTFGFQWQLYGSLDSRERGRGVYMAPLPVRRGKVVRWPEEDGEPHTLGSNSDFAGHLLEALKKPQEIPGPPFLLRAG